jgi:hypothetical protein
VPRFVFQVRMECGGAPAVPIRSSYAKRADAELTLVNDIPMAEESNCLFHGGGDCYTPQGIA